MSFTNLQFLVSTLIAFAVGFVPFFVYYLSQRRKVCGYKIFTKASLIKVNPAIRGKLSVSYQGNPIENICSFAVLIKNIGTRDIKDQKILFVWDKKAQVIDVNIETDPAVGFGPVSEEEISYASSETGPKDVSVKSYRVGLLNPLDEILFSFITINNGPSLRFDVHAKGDELKIKSFEPNSFVSPSVNKIIYSVATVISAIAVIVLLGRTPKFIQLMQGQELKGRQVVALMLVSVSVFFIPFILIAGSMIGVAKKISLLKKGKGKDFSSRFGPTRPN